MKTKTTQSTIAVYHSKQSINNNRNILVVRLDMYFLLFFCGWMCTLLFPTFLALLFSQRRMRGFEWMHPRLFHQRVLACHLYM